MVSFESNGNFEKAIDWLEDSSKLSKYKSLINRIGKEGVRALSEATPKDTGLTSIGWKYKIEERQGYTDLFFYNDAHPELDINIALIIQLGHGTKNGGYVRPINYIPPAILPVFSKLGLELDRRVTE